MISIAAAFLVGVIALVLVFPAMLLLLVHNTPLGSISDARRDRDNPTYAAQYFGGLVSYDTVLASRRWHPPDGRAHDCTFAIVELSANAPDFPPIPYEIERRFPFALPDAVRSTPWFAPLPQGSELDEYVAAAAQLHEGWALLPRDPADPRCSSISEVFGPNVLHRCRSRIGIELHDRLLAALEGDGSFYRSESGMIFVYSAPQRIAARIRYGD